MICGSSLALSLVNHDIMRFREVLSILTFPSTRVLRVYDLTNDKETGILSAFLY